MSLSFKPLTEAEANGLLPVGIYSFQVKTAENATSKKGNPMIKLCLTLWDKDGKEHTIYDYLMEALPYKLRHFCESVSLMDKYQEGKFDSVDCLGKSGKCKVKIEEAGEFPARNSIQDYVKSDKVEEKPAKVDENGFDEDLPF